MVLLEINVVSRRGFFVEAAGEEPSFAAPGYAERADMEDHRLPPSQNSARTGASLVAVLALTAGYVDSFVLQKYMVFASFMSGNTTQTGLQAGQAQFAEAGQDLLPIPLFVAGVFVGTLLLHSGMRYQLRWLLGLVAALLAVVITAAEAAALPGWFSVTMLSLAMGIMNTSVTQIGAQSVSLGYVTGTLNNLGQHLALAVKRLPVPGAEGPWDTHGRRAVLLGSIWTAFLVGALLAGIVTPRFADWSLVPPTVILLLLSAFSAASNVSTRQG